jgi:hypothetical protein
MGHDDEIAMANFKPVTDDDEDRSHLYDPRYPDLIVEHMLRIGKPITRTNYIEMARSGRPDEDAPWDREDEADMPDFLRRAWSEDFPK